MRLSSNLVFEDLIFGTTATWYTPPTFNDILGQSDVLGIQACTRLVTGTSPVLTLQSEHSVDGRNWVNLRGTAEISTAIASETSYYGQTGVGTNVLAPPLSLVRFRVTLTGTNPQCYLKVYATGRTYGG